MKQNKYDDAGFFANYSQMPRSIGGLGAAGEWEVFRSMLPDLGGKRVLDLGCGYGWHCRYAREQQALSVVGVDLSSKMLDKARAMTDDPAIEYRNLAIEDIEWKENEFDVVISSLAFHYIESFAGLCRNIERTLVAGGSFVFSVEHPIYTALAAQDWHYGAEGEKLHWPVDGYHEEGARHTNFLEHSVTKYHRSVSTYLNTLLQAGFAIQQMSELQPNAEMLERNAAWQEEVRRPMFMLVAASKR
jgi:SAM-dependent methyltransferase